MAQSLDQQTETPAYPNQQTISIAFQGERGAFGDEAARAYFGKYSEAQPRWRKATSTCASLA